MQKLADKLHYYFPGAALGALVGSRIKDTDPMTGEESFNPIATAIGAGVGALGGHVAGKKLPAYFLKQKLLARDEIITSKLQDHLTDTLRQVAKNAPKTNTYYDKNIGVVMPPPSSVSKAVSKIMSEAGEHTRGLAKPLDFATKKQVEAYADSLPLMSLKSVLHRATNVAGQDLSKEMGADYLNQIQMLRSSRDLHPTLVSRALAKVKLSPKDLEKWWAGRQMNKYYENGASDQIISANKKFFKHSLTGKD